MSETEHDGQAEGDDDAQPVSPETAVDAGDDDVEAEAAEDGAEASAEAPGGEPEPEPEPETPETQTARDDREIEKAAKALIKLATSNANAISRIMGEDAQNLEPCPRCMGGDASMPKTPGFIWPANLVPLLPEHKAAVKLSIGEGVEPEWVQAEDASRCPKCGGRGKVKTDSFVPGQERLKCLDCNGRGWIGAREHREHEAPSNNVPEFAGVAAGAPHESPEQDPWGRLRDDPLYGVMPGFERD
jgi:hypothetical protein